MPPKEKKLSFENGDLAKTCIGTSAGCLTPLILREYVDKSYPDGVPYINTVVPWPWSNVSVIGGLCLGAGSLIAGLLIKSWRFALIPMGIGSLSVSTMLGLSIPPKELAGRVPAGRLKSPAPAIRLTQAGTPSRINNPSSNPSFLLTNPRPSEPGGSVAPQSEISQPSLYSGFKTQAEEDLFYKLKGQIPPSQRSKSAIPLRT